MDASFLLDRPIAFQRPFVALGIGITGALMLSQAVYWSRRKQDEGGWFFKRQVDWEDETGLTRREQEGARSRLCALGILLEERRGVPGKLFYKVDFDVLNGLLERIAAGEQINAPNRQSGMHQTANLGGTKPPICAGENRQSVQAKSAKQYRRKAPIYIDKTTTETTTETTADISSAGGADAPPAAREEIAMVLTAPSGRVYEIPASLRYPKEEAQTHKAWMAYAIAYQHRYGTWPVWNASVAGQVAQLIQRVGIDAAPKVAAHYVMRVNEAFVLKKMHSFKLLLADAEGYHSQMQSGRSVTATSAAQQDRTEANASAADEAAAKAMAILANRQGGAHE